MLAPLGQLGPAAGASRMTGVEAAKGMEALFLEQLLSAMGDAGGDLKLFGDGFQGEMFMQMFMSSVASDAAKAGTGLGEALAKATARLGDGDSGSALSASRAFRSYGAESRAASGVPSNRRLGSIAEEWLGGGRSERWSKDGRLREEDLAAEGASDARGGVAHFNVRDADGYKGHNKCNLFAFELIRRAGYTVPLAARSRGWGYMGADAVARHARAGEVDWAEVRTRWDAADLDAAASSGEPLLMASSAPGDREGHMGVADRVHSIRRGDDGRIAAVEYSGWEAGASGARYGRHTWRVEGVPGVGRGGLDGIEILAPRMAAEQSPFSIERGARPGASVLDGSYSRKRAQATAARADIGS